MLPDDTELILWSEEGINLMAIVARRSRDNLWLNKTTLWRSVHKENSQSESNTLVESQASIIGNSMLGPTVWIPTRVQEFPFQASKIG